MNHIILDFTSNKKQQGGNALIIILIAVILFALLSHAVLSTHRVSGGVGRDDAKLGATRILNYATAVEVGVQRLIATGLQPADIYFYSPIAKMRNGNFINPPSSPAPPKSRWLFHPSGGDVAPAIFPQYAKSCLAVCEGTDSLDGHPSFRWYPAPSTGTEKPDLVLLLPAITDAICKEINKTASIGLYIPSASYGLDLTVAYAQSPAGLPNLMNAAEKRPLTGKPYWCINAYNYANRNFFIYTLWQQ